MFFYENSTYVELNLKFIEKYFREKYGVHEYDNIITNSVPSEFDLSKIFKYNNRISISHHQAHANSDFYQSPYNEAIEATYRLVQSDFTGPVNIGSEEMVSINQLVEIVSEVANKTVVKKYKLDGPLGVKARNSNNDLIQKKIRVGLYHDT